MNGLTTHFACLRQLERDRRREASRSSLPLGLFVVASISVGIALGACWWLESLVGMRFGGR